MADDKTSYDVDVVFCIDVTQSMDPYIEQVKKLSLNFTKRMNDRMNEKGKAIRSLRVRLVSFRDIGDEGNSAIQTTRFFELPSEEGLLRNAVDGLYADGGGNIPESGLEGLWVAMNSRWSRSAATSRHVIVVASDAPAHRLGTHFFELEQSKYPTPKSLAELERRWGIDGFESDAVMDFNSRRLVVLAPDCEPWTTIGNTWGQSLFFVSAAGEGIDDVDFDQIVNIVAESV